MQQFPTYETKDVEIHSWQRSAKTETNRLTFMSQPVLGNYDMHWYSMLVAGLLHDALLAVRSVPRIFWLCDYMWLLYLLVFWDQMMLHPRKQSWSKTSYNLNMDPLEEEIPLQIMKSSIFRFQWSNSRANQVDSTPSAHLRAEKIIVNALGVHNGVLKGRFCEAKVQVHFASIF